MGGHLKAHRGERLGGSRHAPSAYSSLGQVHVGNGRFLLHLRRDDPTQGDPQRLIQAQFGADALTGIQTVAMEVAQVSMETFREIYLMLDLEPPLAELSDA